MIGIVRLICRPAISVVRDVGKQCKIRNGGGIHDRLTFHEIQVALPASAFRSSFGIVIGRIAVNQSFYNGAFHRTLAVFLQTRPEQSARVVPVLETGIWTFARFLVETEQA